jgi:23S rRNA (cytidine1920-2'-O)/16S rRNA (cytidine1409-2'-O)-methyltransferase
MAKTERLDVIVVERGLLQSRQAAQAAIMDGGVLVNGNKVTKPGAPIKLDATVELTSNWKGSPFVSRGGLKLERALDVFAIDVSQRICLDLGASTGGFTDCLLKRGAAQVYAIDVGYGQLDWKLRQDPRVVVKERLNARLIKPEDIYTDDNANKASLAVADLSFISVLKVLPACIPLLTEPAEVVALIKPQFEAGKELVGKGGVVRSKEAHLKVLKDSLRAAEQLNLRSMALTYSPVKGPAGNIEFLVHWCCGSSEPTQLNIEQVVEEAHRQLNTKMC